MSSRQDRMKTAAKAWGKLTEAEKIQNGPWLFFAKAYLNYEGKLDEEKGSKKGSKKDRKPKTGTSETSSREARMKTAVKAWGKLSEEEKIQNGPWMNFAKAYLTYEGKLGEEKGSKKGSKKDRKPKPRTTRQKA